MSRNVLLIEPNYRNKYPPMGLMKISTYYKKLGDNVRFFKGNLQDLIVELLADDLIKILRGIGDNKNLENYKYQIREYIKYGRNADIPDDELFNDVFAKETLKLFRDKFKSKSYFENPPFDVVGISTLFTFHWSITIDTINTAKLLCKDINKVFVGGVAATIVPDHIENETGIRPHIGLLNEAGALGDNNDIIIDTLSLDYSIISEIDYAYPATDAYFMYMTRGCVNKCPFCAVPTIEPTYCEYVPLREQVKITRERFGEQRNLLLLDNNVLASTKFDDIIDEIKECGFERGATYLPPNPYEIAIKNLRDGINDRAYIRVCVRLFDELITKCSNLNVCKDTTVRDELYKKVKDTCCDSERTATKEAILELDEFVSPLYEKYAYHPSRRQRYVDFNQGVDGRLITAKNMKKLAEINIRPLRIAFDTWGMRKIYEKAVGYAAKAGITNLSNYMLYNFNEKPVDLYNRMKLTIDLCERYGITIYSFPMKYHPIDDPEYFRNREYIGKHWSRKYIRAVQAVLTSTHGKIGRGKQFFEAAFGRNEDEFHEILLMPEALIIRRFEHDETMRARYPKYSRPEYQSRKTNEWREMFYGLDEDQRKKVIRIIEKNIFTDEVVNVKDKQIQEVLRFYQITREK